MILKDLQENHNHYAFLKNDERLRGVYLERDRFHSHGSIKRCGHFCKVFENEYCCDCKRQQTYSNCYICKIRRDK